MLLNYYNTPLFVKCPIIFHVSNATFSPFPKKLLQVFMENDSINVFSDTDQN